MCGYCLLICVNIIDIISKFRNESIVMKGKIIKALGEAYIIRRMKQMEGMLLIVNYGLILLFGIFVSILLTGGIKNKKDYPDTFFFCVFMLVIQAVCSGVFGVDFTKKLYPLITHLPLIIFLVQVLKRELGMSIVAVLIAYFCCQLPFWIGILAQAVFNNSYIYQYIYSLMTLVFFYLIHHFFAKYAYQAMTYSKKSLFLFGFLPAVYYIFDYTSTVYTNAFYMGIKMMNEFFPTVMVLFYIWFIVAYHEEVQKKAEAELEKDRLILQMEHAKTQLSVLRSGQEQAAIYRHDLRHHITMLDSFAQQGELNQIKEYLTQAQYQLKSITPMYFCENEVVNLILSSFINKAEEHKVILNIKANLPKEINILDTELCSVILNGLENALHAVVKIQDESKRNISFDCSVNKQMLLIKIKNTYLGEVQMENGVPFTKEVDHGFGCKSIQSIAKARKGLCEFSLQDEIFTLKVVLPFE